MPGAFAKGSSTWNGSAEHILRWFVVLAVQSKVTQSLHSLLGAVSPSPTPPEAPALLPQQRAAQAPRNAPVTGHSSPRDPHLLLHIRTGNKSSSRDVLVLKMTTTVKTRARHCCHPTQQGPGLQGMDREQSATPSKDTRSHPS